MKPATTVSQVVSAAREDMNTVFGENDGLNGENDHVSDDFCDLKEDPDVDFMVELFTNTFH